MLGVVEVASKRQSGRSSAQYSNSSKSTFNQAPSSSNNHEDEVIQYKPPSDVEMLERAREIHSNVDFTALSKGPEKGGPWYRVETADQFVVFKRPPSADIKDIRLPGLDVMCAGNIDANLEEVVSVLRSQSEAEHGNTMEGLHKKNFIFGSLDREVSCSTEESDNQDDEDTDEQLTVKTSSFLRSTVFGHNEQWCFSEFFQRNEQRDGFTISQCALPSLEPTPGRVVGASARVDQLNGLNASYAVDQLPDNKGLRVVYNAWFEETMNIEDSTSSTDRSMSSRRNSALSVESSFSSRSIESSGKGSEWSFTSRSSRSSRNSVVSVGSGLSVSSNSSFVGLNEASDGKMQLRRLLSLAHGTTKLPDLIDRRRYGLQVPADLDNIQVMNSRCPCCTHSLAPVKMSFSVAASALRRRSLKSLKSDTRRCYLCGYLVCMNCWSAENMESTVGRVASIVVCTRCHASVKACDFSEVYSPNQENKRGPVKVVEDNNESLAPLLTDFLAASLMNAPAGEDRAAVLSVVRTLLQENEATEDENGDFSSDDSDSDYDEGFSELQNDNVAVVELGKFLSDEEQLPNLSSCEFANSKKRGYPIAQPDDPVTMVPPTIIPPHEDARLQLVTDKGLMLLAEQLAPVDPAPDAFDSVSDVRDLDILCQLAVRASGCPNTFLSIMGTEHLHILSSSNPAFIHATMPRGHTVCQHTIMTPKPFMISHPEADVRFHELGAIKALSTRVYMGFPLTVSTDDGNGETEMAVGTLCCVSPEARSELTRSQFTTLKRIADTASRLIQLKGRQLQEQQNTE